MADYISREAVREMLEKAQFVSDGEYGGYCTEDVNIDAIPAADVRPVVRGEWEISMDGNGWTVWTKMTCPACKTEFKDLPVINFCPNCGADMTGGSDAG